MDALIPIHDRDGQQVVSARELHDFLEIKSKFADWMKNRINKYGFIENQDFVSLSKILENGGREIDYALTLEMAKELAMVEGNVKGKQARQYFINCEKELRQLAAQPMVASIDLQLQQARILTDHAQRLTEQGQQLTTQHEKLTELEQTVQQIMAGYHPSNKRIPSRSQMPHTRREISTRKQIIELMNAYCQRYNVAQKDAYSWLYDRLNQLYRVNIHNYRVNPADSLLEVAERNYHLDKLHAIIMSELYSNDYGYE